MTKETISSKLSNPVLQWQTNTGWGSLIDKESLSERSHYFTARVCRERYFHNSPVRQQKSQNSISIKQLLLSVTPWIIIAIVRTQIRSFSLSLSLTHTVHLGQCRSALLSDSEMRRWVNPATHSPIKHQIHISSPQTHCSNTLTLSCHASQEKKISVLSPLLPKKSVHFSELSLQTDQSIPLKLVTPCQISRVQIYIRSLLVVFAKWSISTIAHAYCSLNHYLKHFGPIFQLKYLKIIETR